MAIVSGGLNTVTAESNNCNQLSVGVERGWKVSRVDLGITSIQGRLQRAKPGMGALLSHPWTQGHPKELYGFSVATPLPGGLFSSVFARKAKLYQ